MAQSAAFGVGAPPAPATAPAPASPDQAPKAATPPAEKAEKKPLPWHGTYVLFDQSATTQTVGLGSDYQSANPTYEWWVRFAPRYYLFENKDDDLAVNAWFNLYYELTNSDETTKKNEPVIGSTTAWLAYSRKIARSGDAVTSLSLSPVRLGLPTDKASRAAGQWFSLGAGLGVNQSIPINGKSASTFSMARAGLSFIYTHPFYRANVPSNPDFERVRQDTTGHSVTSDVLRGSYNANHQLNIALSASVQATKKLGLSLTGVMLHTWPYTPNGDPCILVLNNCVQDIQHTSDPSTHRVSTWVLGSVDYDLVDELSLGLGYYNFTGQIGPDGQRRNPLWSPDARLFFTVTANLDALYETMSGANADEKKAAREEERRKTQTALVSASSASQL